MRARQRSDYARKPAEQPTPHTEELATELLLAKIRHKDRVRKYKIEWGSRNSTVPAMGVSLVVFSQAGVHQLPGFVELPLGALQQFFTSLRHFRTILQAFEVDLFKNGRTLVRWFYTTHHNNPNLRF